MPISFLTEFAQQRTPATITHTALGGVATFADTDVVIEFRAVQGELTGMTIRNTTTGVAISVDHPDRLANEPTLAHMVAALRRDAGLR